VVKGEAELSACIFNLPQKFSELSEELLALLNKSAISRSLKSGIGNPLKKKD
jgi:hypothetical protein